MTIASTLTSSVTNASDQLLLAATHAQLALNQLNATTGPGPQASAEGVSGSTGDPIAADLPNGDPTAPAGLGDAAGQLIGIGKWVGLVLGIGGIIACGMMMTIGRRNNSRMSADGASGLMWVVAGISVVLLSVPIVGAVSGAF